MNKKTKLALGGGIILIAAVAAVVVLLVNRNKDSHQETAGTEYLSSNQKENQTDNLTGATLEESQKESKESSEQRQSESKTDTMAEASSEKQGEMSPEDSPADQSADLTDFFPKGESGTVDQLLYQDFKNGIISADEYVRNLCYALYESEKLDGRYSLEAGLGREIKPLWIAEEYFDELEDSTKDYLLEHISLEQELIEEEQRVSALNFSLLPQVFLSASLLAAEEPEAEAKPGLEFVVSRNDNFVVWYFTVGPNEMSREAAETIAEGLEDVIEKYDMLFGVEYRFEPISRASGKIGELLRGKLAEKDKDPNLVDNTMQIFMLTFEEAYARYDDIGNKMLTYYIKLQTKMDTLSMQPFPNIMINPSETADMENLEQLYNHEMFHHYQAQILDDHGNRKVTDIGHALESVPIWASGLVTEKTTNKGNNNDFCAMARSNPNLLLDEETLEKHGAQHMSYALLLYLYNYSSFYGDDGLQMVVDAMYEESFLSALARKSTPTDLWQIEAAYALKNLTVDYDNMNFVYNPEEAELNYKEIMGLNEEVKLNRIGAEYYRFRSAEGEQFFRDFSFETDSDYVLALLAGEKDGEYVLLDQTFYGDRDYVLSTETEDGSSYDSYWLVVANADLEKNHTCKIKMTSREAIDTKDSSGETEPSAGGETGEGSSGEMEDPASGAGRSGKFTVEVLDYDSDRKLEHHYETFYYDSTGWVYRMIITNVYPAEDMEDLDLNAEAENLKNSGNYEEAAADGNTLTAEVKASNWSWIWSYKRFESYWDIQNFMENPGTDCVEVPGFTPALENDE